jgi:hypothetical protein
MLTSPTMVALGAIKVLLPNSGEKPLTGRMKGIFFLKVIAYSGTLQE